MTLREFLAIVEIRTKLVSLSTSLLGFLYAMRSTGTRPRPLVITCLAAVLLVDMGTTAFNSFFDYWRGEDTKRRNRERDKVLVHEGTPPLLALLVAFGCFGAAALLGLYLAWKAGAWVLGWGAASLLAGFLYSGGPRPISRSPFGELVAGGFLGSLLFVLVARIQAGLPPPGVLPASLPTALLIGAVLAMNNACDYEADRAAGRRTLAILIGRRRRALPLLVLALTAYLSAAALILAGIYPRAAVLGLAPAALVAVLELRASWRRGFRAETKGPGMKSVLRILLSYSLGLGLALALG